MYTDRIEAKRSVGMYRLVLELELKNDMNLKESYEKISTMVRFFIHKNNKGLKASHYEKKFSYYTFSNFFPAEKDALFKKGNRYEVELRSINEEFLDLRAFKQLETDDLILVGVNAGRLYYRGQGFLKSETPVYFNTKRIQNEQYEQEVKEKIRENILFRYVKSGLNTNDDLDFLRKEIIEEISISKKVITIPFQKKKLANGNDLLYHCLHVDIKFKDNDIAREVEKVIYVGGLGLNTSNGFGLMKSGVS